MKLIQQMQAKEALLTAEYLRKILDYNPKTGEFHWKVNRGFVSSGSKAGRLSKYGYLRINISKKEYKAHRLAWLYYYGEWPKNENYYIDHINGNKADNRICNLRVVTKSDNGRNMSVHSDNTSGYPGVYFNKICKKWQAYISGDIYNNETKMYKRQSLGYFTKLEEAVKARKEAEKKYGYTVRK